MAIGATLLTSIADVNDATSYTTGSFTPAANCSLLIFTSESIAAGAAPRAVPSGGGLVYEEEATHLFSNTPGVRRVGCWTAPVGGSPSSMTITFTMTDSQGSGTTSTSFFAAVIEVTDQNTTRLIHQILHPDQQALGVTPDASTGPSVALASALDADNRPFSWWYHRANEATTFRTNWTELFDGNVATPAGGAESQWRSDAFETTASASWATAQHYDGIAVEVNHSATTATVPPKPVAYSVTQATSGPVSVFMPDGYANGDLLLAYISTDAASTVAQGGSDGWTSITSTANGSEVRLTILAKLSDGSDALTLTLGGADDCVAVVHRITNHGVSDVSTDIAVGTAATGTSISPDPPSLTPPSSKDWLFIAVAGCDDDDITNIGGTWWPTNYARVCQARSTSGTSSCMVDVAYRKLSTGSAENPSAFTLAASEEWVAQTLAIPPAAAATNITATTVTIPVEIPVPTVAVTVGITPDPVTVTAEVPTATVTASATITPPTISIPIDVPTPTITATATITPNPVDVLVEIPVATATTTIPISPDPVTIPIEVPSATVETSVNATITPDPVTIVVEVPTPTITASATITPDPVTIPVEVPTPSVTATVAITPSPVVIAIDVPGSTITTAATINPATVTIPVEVPTATVTASATISLDPVTIPIDVPAVTVTASPTITPNPVDVLVEIPVPTIGLTQVISPDPVTILVELPLAEIVARSAVIAGTILTPHCVTPTKVVVATTSVVRLQPTTTVLTLGVSE